MNKRGLLLAVFLLSMPLVCADIVGSTFDSLGFDIVGTYNSNPIFIDFIIYMIIFVSVANMAFKSKMGEGKAGGISAGIGVALSIPLVVYESSAGLNLGMLGPLAGAILILLVCVAIFLGLRKTGVHNTGAIALAYFVGYFTMRSAFPDLYRTIQLRYELLEIVMFVAVIISIFAVVSWLTSSLTGRAKSAAEYDKGKPGLLRRVAGGLFGAGKGIGAAGWGIGKGINGLRNMRKKELKELHKAERDELAETAEEREGGKLEEKELEFAIKDIEEIDELIKLIELHREKPENLKRIGQDLMKLNDDISHEKRLKKKMVKITEHMNKTMARLEEKWAALEKSEVTEKSKADIKLILKKIESLEAFEKQLKVKVDQEQNDFKAFLTAAVGQLNRGDARAAIENLMGAEGVKKRMEQALLYEKQVSKDALLQIGLEEKVTENIIAELQAAA